ncbi:MAG: hypothetical protein CMK74_21435 [Pseudomonadales bacterium]|nr:hypothetical protein [Pseudomonadales bacterium]
MSEKAKFTAGPWVADGYGWIAAESGESVVDYAGCGSHEACWDNPADRALVLSAPELYVALERLKIEIVLSDVDMDYIDSHFKPHLERAEKALAKARGES